MNLEEIRTICDEVERDAKNVVAEFNPTAGDLLRLKAALWRMTIEICDRLERIEDAVCEVGNQVIESRR